MARQGPMFWGSSCAHTTSVTFEIAGEELVVRRERERVELLQPGDRDTLGRVMPLVPDDVVVDLPGAKDEAARLPPSLFVERGVVEDRAEALHEVLQVRCGSRSRSRPFGGGRAGAASGGAPDGG